MAGIPQRRWWDAFGPGRFAVGAVAIAGVLAGALWHQHPAGIAVLVIALLVGFFVVLRPAIRQAEFGLVIPARGSADTFVTGIANDLEAGREEVENCAHLLADDPQQATEWIHEAWSGALQGWRGPGGPALRTYVLGQLASFTLERGGSHAGPRSGPEPGVLSYLPPPRRVVFVLCRIAGFSPEEVAKLLGQPVGLVARELQVADDAVVAVEGA